MTGLLVGSLIVIGILTLYIIALFNGLMRSKNRIDYTLGGIDAILKKRFDLIPNLVSIVKEYMTFEQETLTKIVNLRNQNSQNYILQDEGSSKIIKSILLTVENYPDLKANHSFIQLQQELSEVEGQLAAARRTYNASVFIFNNKVETIPSNMIAKIMKFKTMPMFIINDNEKKKPDLKELFNQ